MIDTHAHLDGHEYEEDLNDVIARAKLAGINHVFIPNINTVDLPHLLDTCKEHADYLWPMLGIHPEEIHAQEEENRKDLDTINKLLKKLQENDYRIDENLPSPKIIAIGEVGLDYYWDDSLKEQQKYVFAQQVEWAQFYKLPLMIHARKAHTDLIQILHEHGADNSFGVFHCFSGTKEEAKELIQQFPNFALGIGGILTFKKSTLPNVLKDAQIPLERIVLETDSPYMSPVPYRGQRNESAYVVEVAKKLSQLYEISIDEVDRITTQNCKRIFKNGPWDKKL